MGLDTVNFLKCELLILHMFYKLFLALQRGDGHFAADFGADVPEPRERVGRGYFFLFWEEFHFYWSRL